MANYAIGDLQGCYDALCRLLDHLQFNEHSDCLWFTGDLVNRGPDSLACLRFIKQLPNTRIVLGNHDLHLLAVNEALQASEPGDSLTPILQAADGPELCHWLRHLPLLYHDPRLDYVLVHAGIYPWWTLNEAKAYAREVESVLQGSDYRDFLAHMYGDIPNHWQADLRDQARLRFITNCFTTMRYCYHDGRLDFQHKQAPGNQAAELIPWFELIDPNKISPRILFGHWANLKAQHPRGPQVFNLDGGCVWGGALVAMDLEKQHYLQSP